MGAVAEPAGRIELQIRGMHCAGCVGTVESALQRAPGVQSAAVNLATESATVWLADPTVQPAALLSAVRAAGYDAALAGPERPAVAASAERRRRELDDQRWRLLIGLVLGLPIVLPHLLHLASWAAALAGVHWHPPGLDRVLGIAPQAAWIVEGVLAAGVLYVTGGRIIAGAARALRHAAANMDLLVSMGAVAAFAGGVAGVALNAERLVWFADAAMIVLFVSLGKYLEARARGRASAALEALFARLPTEAVRVTGSGEERVPAAALRVGDRVRIAAHTAVPTDGEIVSGGLSVDESVITGESAPQERGPGQPVLGGTRAVDGLAEVRVTAVARESAVGRIARLVEEAQAIKPQWQRLADRAAAAFVPLVLALCAATFAFWLWHAGTVRGVAEWAWALERAIAVLVVACPCAMGLAVPTAVLVGTTRAAERGVLVRNPDALEAVGAIRDIILDKTGTLTLGRPRLEALEPVAGLAPADAQRRAAALAALSEHPLSRALLEAAPEFAGTAAADGRPALVHPGRSAGAADVAPPVTEFVSTPGMGLRGRVAGRLTLLGSARWVQENGVDVARWTERADALAARGHSIVWLAGADGVADAAPSVLALLAFADAIHPEANAAVRELRALGVRARILSGDRHAAVSAVANALGIDEFEAELSPADKLKRVRALADRGRRTIFFGDGVNDAAALAAADVGVAVGAGADVAREAADLCLIGHAPGLIPTAIRLSRASARVMKQNLFWAFAYNVLMLPVAAATPLPPAAATAAMMLSSFSVVANSLRLRRA